MSQIAIIPARAGSKGLPGKNVRELNGKPLIAYTIQAAIESSVFDDILVTSDDPKVLDCAKELNVRAIERPRELSTDEVSLVPVVEHAFKTVKQDFDGFALLQPTSPLRNALHIQEAFRLFATGEYKSVVSVCKIDHPPQKALLMDGTELSPLTNWDDLYKNRQDLKPAYRQNGALWFVDRMTFQQNKRFVSAPVGAYEMCEQDSIDIDTLDDFIKIEKILSGKC